MKTNSASESHQKTVLALDIDEVLALFVPKLVEYHNYVDPDHPLTPSAFFSYEFHKVWGGSKEDCAKKVSSLMHCL